MPMHVVEKGETIQTIAKKHGFRQWRRIFEHPNNAKLRRQRPNPDVLAPGDQVFVPELETKTEPARVDEKTVFVLAPVRRELVLCLRDAGDALLAGVPYKLDVEGTTHEGIVDPEGRIRHDIEVDAREATLTLELDDEVTTEIELQIGALDPVDTDEGVRARLYNLGFLHATDATLRRARRRDGPLPRVQLPQGARRPAVAPRPRGPSVRPWILNPRA